MSRLTDKDVMLIAEIKRDAGDGLGYGAQLLDLLAIIDRLSIDATKGTGNITSEEINKIVTLVQDLRAHPDEQLTILTHALVVGCKANGVDVLDAINNFALCFDDKHEVINDGAPAPGGRLDS